MTATPPLGAYIIRNRYTSTVIHTDDGVTVKSSSRDEEHQRERQIWWIEAIAGPEGDETKVVYRITNIAKDISLAVSGGSCEDKSEVTVHSTHGAPWQLWRFERQLGIAEGEYYRIFNANSGLALDTCNIFCTRKLLLGYLSQFWELQKPVMSVPAGWLRIQNVASGQVLSQTCSSLPPITVLPPTSSTPNESWATQWVFVQASTFGDGSEGNRSYVIKNRLTGTILRCEKSKEFHREAVGSINAWDPKCYGNDPELWSFEVDAGGNWRVAHKSRSLLEETDVELLGGNEVICTTRTHHKKKCWAFVAMDRSVATSCPAIRNI